jgi:hypothetical protein
MCRYPTIIVVFVLKEIYFTKDGAKKCPKGKLYSKYFIKLRSFKSQEFVVSKLQNNTESEIQTRVFEESNIELGNTRSLK